MRMPVRSSSESGPSGCARAEQAERGGPSQRGLAELRAPKFYFDVELVQPQSAARTYQNLRPSEYGPNFCARTELAGARLGASRLRESCSQSGLERLKAEFMLHRQQPRGDSSLACQQERLGHFAESESQGESGYRKNCRTVKNVRQDACEFGIAHGIRRHHVPWPADPCICDGQPGNCR